MLSTSLLPFTVGKFRFTPLVKKQQPGHFLASLSVRRGQGQQTHDHVYTFTPIFGSRVAALEYAVAQGLDWLADAKPRGQTLIPKEN